MSANLPNIPIGLDLDLEPLFAKLAELDSKLEAFAQKSSRVIVNALSTDPEFAKQFETSIKSADSTLSKFLGRVSSLSGSLNGALDKVGEAVVANVQSGLESVVGGISNDLKQAGTEMGTAATNAIRAGLQVVSNELKTATEKTAANFQQNIANLIQQAEGAASKVSGTISGKGSVKANAPVTAAARSDIDDIIGGQAQLDGLAKRIAALNQLADQFKQNFGEDFAGAEVLVRRALDALNADLGSFEKNLVALRAEELNQKNSADALSTQLTKLRSDLATTSAQLADITKGKITDDNKGVAQALANRVNLLQNEIKILDPVQKAAAQGAQTLAQKFDLVKKAAEQAGLTVKKTADGVLAFTKVATTSDQFSPKNLQKDIEAHRQSLERAEAASLKFDQALAKDTVTIARMGKTLNDTNQQVDKAKKKFEELTAAQDPFSRESLHSHDAMLAILGISRLLPGGLGQAVSGFALLDGATRSVTGTLIGAGGVAFAVIAQLAQAAAQFNQVTNQIRAQAEGLGLTVEEVKALDFVLKQTDGSIENFAVGIKKINQAVTGIGPEAKQTKVLLETIFADQGFKIDRNTQVIDVIKLIAANIDQLEKSGLAGAVAGEIFGRSWDEVKGRLKDLNDQLEDAEKKIHASGTASEDAVKTAKSYTRAIADLSLEWEKFVRAIKVPQTITILLKFASSLGGNTNLKDLLAPGSSGFFDFLKGAEGTALSTTKNLFSGQGLFKAFEDNLRAAEAERDRIETATRAAIRKASEGNKVFQDELKKNFGIGGSTIDSVFPDTAQLQQSNDKVSGLRQQLLEKLRQERTGTKDTATAKAINAEEIAILEDEKRDKDRQLQLARQTLEVSQQVASAKENEASNLPLLSVQRQQLVKVAQERERQALADVIKGQIEVDTLGKQIAELKKQDKGHKGLTDAQRDAEATLREDVEELRHQATGLDATSPEAQKLFGEIKGKRQAFIAALQSAANANDPAVRNVVTRLQKENDREAESQNRSQGAQLLADAERSFAAFKEHLALAIESKKAQSEDSARLLKAEFEAGLAPFTDVIKGEIEAAESFLGEFKASSDNTIRGLEAEIVLINRLRDSGGIDPKSATDQIRQKEAAIAKEQLAQEKATTDNAFKTSDIEEKAAAELRSRRQKLRDINLQEFESEGERRVHLVQEIGKNILEAERQAIIIERDFQSESHRRRLDDLNRQFADITKFRVRFDDETKQLVTKFVDNPQQASAGDIDALIAKIKSLGQNAPEGFIGILEQILKLKQGELTNIQTSAFKLEENGLALEQRRLDVLRTRLDLENAIVDARSQQIAEFKSSGLITDNQAATLQLQVEREKLAILQQELDLNRQKQSAAINAAAAPFKVASALTGQDFNTPATTAAVAQNKAVVDLTAEQIKLNQQYEQQKLRVEIAGSILGRLAVGFDALAQKASNLPAPFNGLSQVFTDVAKAIRLIQGAQIKTPAQNIETATKTFHDQVIDAANKFVSRVTNPPSSNATSPATAEGEKIGKAISDKVTASLDVAGGLLQGFTASTTGGKVSGFGGAIGGLGGLFKAGSGLASALPVVGAIAGVAGGIMDFIGSIWKKKAEATAQKMQDAFQTIMRKFQDGTITLGEAIKQTEDQVQKARQQLGSGKIGKKGGKASLVGIEQQAADQIRQLRESQKRIQSDFLTALGDLRIPKEARGDAQAFRDAVDKARAFINSFETAGEKLAHFGEAQEFLNRTLTELREDAIKQLNDILKQQQDSERAFQKTRLDLIRQGRPSTPLQEAQDRLTQLFELEQKHLQEQVDSEKQQDALRERVGLLDNAFSEADKILSKLEKTFSGLNQTLSGLGSNSNLGNTIGSGGTTNNNNVNLSFNFTGASQQQVNQALDTVENRLSRLGLTNNVAGSFNSGRPFTP